jgi:hypothetical protein
MFTLAARSQGDIAIVNSQVVVEGEEEEVLLSCTRARRDS